MRGRLMKMFTKDQHELILAKHPDDAKAAEAYSIAGHVPIGRTLVRYWRTVFQVNEGNQLTPLSAMQVPASCASLIRMKTRVRTCPRCRTASACCTSRTFMHRISTLTHSHS